MWCGFWSGSFGIGILPRKRKKFGVGSILGHQSWNGPDHPTVLMVVDARVEGVQLYNIRGKI